MGQRVAIIVVAAGSGTRLGHSEPKAFVELHGATILERALRGVFESSEQAQVIVVAPKAKLAAARRIAELAAGAASSSVYVVTGGDTRQASVVAGLAAVHPEVEVVLVHDAARALTSGALIDRVARAVTPTTGVIPALPVTDTIKAVDPTGSTVTGTVDRAGLRAVQTPQGFRREVLVRAHAECAGDAATDDAGLVERIGLPVTVIPGHVEAFKVTTRFDLLLAEAVLAARR